MRTKSVKWALDEVNIPGVPISDYHKETAFQIYCADWLRKQYSRFGNEGFRRWHHSANERDGVRAGFIAKMMGQSRGFPDFVHFGLQIAVEFKVPGGKVSNDQKEWLDYFESLGYRSEVVYTFERFRAIVLERITMRQAGTGERQLEP